MDSRFLPIGTVVRLKGGIKPVMISGYCIVPRGKQQIDGKLVEVNKVFEYGGCMYPEGVLQSNETHVFNHDQIEEILFLGYETKEQKELSDLLNKSYEIFKKQIANKN